MLGPPAVDEREERRPDEMSDAPIDNRRAELASRLLVALLAGLFLLGLLGFVVAVLDAADDEGAPAPPSLPVPSLSSEAFLREVLTAQPRILVAMAEPAAGDADPAFDQAAPDPTGDPATPDPDPILDPATPVPTDPDDLGAASVAESDASSVAGPGAPGDQVMPVVPVARFWSDRDGLARRDIVRALENGELPGFRRIVVEDSIREALAETLGLDIHPAVEGGDAAAVGRAIRRGGLGLLAAADLAPSMRPLTVDGRSLVGNDRVRSADAWPLTVTQTDEAGWDQSRTWVLVAGGDSFTDRGVYDKVIRRGKGVDYPFDGGTARVTGHGCCDPVFNDNVVPRYELTGNKGVVRRLFKDAELAIANHEMPVTDAWGFHSSGLRFSGKPELTEIFTRAGIDWMSLANNHIKDYDTDGIRDSRRILRRYGIASGGAGVDLDQARRISYLEVGKVGKVGDPGDSGVATLAIIPCVGVVPYSWAGPDASGGTPCLDRYLVPDIKEAGRKADVVLVFPHWGVEYTRLPMPSQRKHAARWVKAGADLVLGAHSHVAGAIEDIDGVPVLYSLGNLIFDQHWSTNTMESMLVEATFHEGTLISLELVPYIIHDTSQPNLLDPATGEGKSLRQQVQAASADWLDW
jgi:poly-gamma-glutamate capsule biosynthesis protein CapA/YwtB (metallophosphatase superfamily)